MRYGVIPLWLFEMYEEDKLERAVQRAADLRDRMGNRLRDDLVVVEAQRIVRCHRKEGETNGR